MKDKITFKFTDLRFEYALPVIHDLDFIESRRCELIECTKLLKEKIATLDIETAKGSADFSIANHLVRYYFRAGVLLNYAEENIRYGDVKDNAKNAIKHNSRFD